MPVEPQRLHQMIVDGHEPGKVVRLAADPNAARDFAVIRPDILVSEGEFRKLLFIEWVTSAGPCLRKSAAREGEQRRKAGGGHAEIAGRFENVLLMRGDAVDRKSSRLNSSHER